MRRRRAVVPGASVAPGAVGDGVAAARRDPARAGRARANPFGLLAWLFTPIFQALFIFLVCFDQLTGNIGIAIILMTLVVRAALIPLFRRQTCRRSGCSSLQPELKELQRRYKGDRAKCSKAQMELYKERGVNPARGCLPLLLQLLLLIPCTRSSARA